MINNINVIDEVNFDTRFPMLNSKITSDLNQISKEMYLQIYSTYSTLFRKYLIKELNLKKYDDIIANSELNYVKVESRDMDIYQSFTKDVLNYFYIRNNLYIENLAKDEKEYIFTKYLMDDTDLDKETETFIEKTYPKVIFENVNHDNSLCDINFGPDNQQYYAPNNAVVIGIRYDEFNLNGLSDQEWDKLHEKQLDHLLDIISNLENNEILKSNLPLITIIYNEYSVKKKLKTESIVSIKN